MEEEQTLKVVRKCQCGGCQKYFSGNTTFDQHRISISKGAPSSERRCMTTEEMQASGMSWEYCMVSVMYENKRSKEKHEVWYDVAGREAVRAAFHKDEQEEAGEE